MFEDKKELLKSERRGRALAIALKPKRGQKWRIEARRNPDGAALLAAARWARRFGAEVEIAVPDEPEPPDYWQTLTIYPAHEGFLRRTKNPMGDIPLVVNSDGMELRIKNIPSDAESWSRTLSESWRMAEPATGATPRMTTAQCRAVDGAAINRFGVPGLCLMENASMAALAVAKDMLSEHEGKHILIAAGGGNNGGDGLAMARGLHVLGIGCEVALLKPAEGLAGDARDNYALLRELPVAIHEIHANAGVLADLSGKADLIVDALLGTGFKGRLSEPFHVAIDSLNRSGKPILAVDIPSGLDGDSGAVADLAVTAERTITFAAIKIGLGQGDGPSRSGRIYIGDIGAPAETLIAGEDPANR